MALVVLRLTISIISLEGINVPLFHSSASYWAVLFWDDELNQSSTIVAMLLIKSLLLYIFKEN